MCIRDRYTPLIVSKDLIGGFFNQASIAQSNISRCILSGNHGALERNCAAIQDTPFEAFFDSITGLDRRNMSGSFLNLIFKFFEYKLSTESGASLDTSTILSIGKKSRFNNASHSGSIRFRNPVSYTHLTLPTKRIV